MSSPLIYLDYQATTPVDPRVLEAMLPYFTQQFGNAGSISHELGRAARDAVQLARATIASSLSAQPNEIVFTSGATESNNLALRGVMERTRRRGKHIVSVATEHKAILDPLAHLARRDCEVTLLPVDATGLLNLEQLISALRDDTCLVSVMLANNEIGTIQPLAEVGRICRERGMVFHTDATQAVGKLPIDVESLYVDLLSFSAHKFFGPKGVGGLYIRRSAPPVRLESQIDGGGQEGGLRSGTLNVPGIVGMAKALQIAVAEMAEETTRLANLRDTLFSRLQDKIPELQINGPPLDQRELRLSHNLNCTFPGVQGETLMLSMPELALSSGSACTSANPEPSHVLQAIGRTPDQTRSSLRFGLGRFTTESEIEKAAEIVVAAVRKLRPSAGSQPQSS